jgi:hypothetical protein
VIDMCGPDPKAYDKRDLLEQGDEFIYAQLRTRSSAAVTYLLEKTQAKAYDVAMAMAYAEEDGTKPDVRDDEFELDRAAVALIDACKLGNYELPGKWVALFAEVA